MKSFLGWVGVVGCLVFHSAALAGGEGGISDEPTREGQCEWTHAQAGFWCLKRGEAIHDQLHDWARKAGWTLIWRPEFSWLTAADAQFAGDFPESLTAVIQALFAEGEPVRLVLWEANRVAEVVSHDR
jgi:hypothetical protein